MNKVDTGSHSFVKLTYKEYKPLALRYQKEMSHDWKQYSKCKVCGMIVFDREVPLISGIYELGTLFPKDVSCDEFILKEALE